MIHALLLAVLTMFPVMNGENRQCIESRIDRIEQQVAEAIRAYPRVRPAYFIAIAFIETHLGCDRGAGGNWGAPISALSRHVAGTHMHGARLASRSLEVCGDELSAARRFRTGLCNPMRQSSSAEVGRIGEQYGRRVMRIAARLEQLAAGR